MAPRLLDVALGAGFVFMASESRAVMRVHRHPHEATIVKTCDCGARYALKAWEGLEFRGMQETYDEDLFLELRDCARCHSTLSLTIHAPQVPAFDPAATLATSGPFDSFGLSP